MRNKSPLYSIVLLSFMIGFGYPSAFQKQVNYGDTPPVSINILSQTTVISPIDIVWQMLGQVNQARTLTDLRKLTGEESICIDSNCYTLTNRRTGTEGLHWAKDYIEQQLVSLGYSVEFFDWSYTEPDYADQDLIVKKPGVFLPGEEIYFIAHMDGVSGPTADDDASGVVDILELARILSNHSFSRTVTLLFTTGEEQGTLGVQSYLNHLTEQELSAIKYAVDIDMIGYDLNDDGVMELWHGGHAPSLALAQMIAETIEAYQIDLEPGLVAGCG